jgi:hypothetical protein
MSSGPVGLVFRPCCISYSDHPPPGESGIATGSRPAVWRDTQAIVSCPDARQLLGAAKALQFLYRTWPVRFKGIAGHLAARGEVRACSPHAEGHAAAAALGPVGDAYSAGAK